LENKGTGCMESTYYIVGVGLGAFYCSLSKRVEVRRRGKGDRGGSIGLKKDCKPVRTYGSSHCVDKLQEGFLGK